MEINQELEKELDETVEDTVEAEEVLEETSETEEAAEEAAEETAEESEEKKGIFGKKKEKKDKKDLKIEELEDNVQLLCEIARSRNCLSKGNELDYSKAAILLIDDFRSGRLGKLTLEFPPISE